MRIAVCPGSFDPCTNGHLDVFTRAAALADRVIVAVLINRSKSSLFTVDERIEMLREVVAPLGNVEVDSFYGLLVDYCKDHDVRSRKADLLDVVAQQADHPTIALHQGDRLRSPAQRLQA